VRAQILDERSRRVQELSDVLLLIHQNNHDARSALQAATAYADLVPEPAAQSDGREHRDAVAHERGLRAALKRLDELLEESRRIAHAQQTGRPETEPTNALGVARDVLSSARARFPAVDLICTVAPADSEEMLVAMCGGAAALHRVLENLVANACEGDGRRGASRVEIVAEAAAGVGAAKIEVRDDGPGFDPELLGRPIEGFESRKPDGLGLGLYTAERLVRASGGSVQRANRAEGGASVSLFLELEAAA
jgi:signal transduction histidine kinase